MPNQSIIPLIKHYLAAVLMTLLAVGAIAVWASPARTPAIVRTVVQKGGQFCFLLEGEDREACAGVALVASALASRGAPSAVPSALPAGAGGAP